MGPLPKKRTKVITQIQERIKQEAKIKFFNTKQGKTAWILERIEALLNKIDPLETTAIIVLAYSVHNLINESEILYYRAATIDYPFKEAGDWFGGPLFANVYKAVMGLLASQTPLTEEQLKEFEQIKDPDLIVWIKSFGYAYIIIKSGILQSGIGIVGAVALLMGMVYDSANGTFTIKYKLRDIPVKKPDLSTPPSNYESYKGTTIFIQKTNDGNDIYSFNYKGEVYFDMSLVNIHILIDTELAKPYELLETYREFDITMKVLIDGSKSYKVIINGEALIYPDLDKAHLAVDLYWTEFTEPPPEPPPDIFEPTYLNECESFDGFSFYGKPPTIEEAAFKFRILPGEIISTGLYTNILDFGYGEYKVSFAVNGARPNINHYCPLWLHDMQKQGGYEEIDFMEMYGSNMYGGQSSRQISMTTYHGSTMNNESTGMYDANLNFEDGNYHEITIIYTPNSVTQYLDGIIQKQWFPATDKLAVPPMRLAIYAESDGLSETEWIMWVNSIAYKKLIQ